MPFANVGGAVMGADRRARCALGVKRYANAASAETVLPACVCAMSPGCARTALETTAPERKPS
eukprot:5610526-Lingulodinium_polyedra.AAC.1